MKRILLVAVLLLGLTAGVAVAQTQERPVEFETLVDDYMVQRDGVIVELHADEASAMAAAETLKVAHPESLVVYGHRSVRKANLVEVTPGTTVPPPTTGTTSPVETSSTTAGLPTTQPPTSQPPPDSGKLVWGKDATAPDASWTRPELGASYVDETYNTNIRRVSDATDTRFNRNTYSRRQAENADGTKFLTYHGAATYNVYDRTSLELVAETTIHPDGEPQWHPTDPNLIRHVAGPNSYVGDLKLYEYDVRTGQSQEIADLTDRIQSVAPTALYMSDHAEGSPSVDGNRWAWLVHDKAEAIIGIVSYDLSTDTVLGGTTELLHPEGHLDWVSMSPSGSYVLAGYWEGTYAYEADLSEHRQLNGKAEHSDIAINGAGNDAYVHIDFSSGPDGGWLLSDDLVTGERIRLFDLYDNANTSIHISGKGYDKPGWALVSTYNCKVPGAWSCNKVMAVELVPNGRILQLAHTHNCGDNYWTETHAVANRDFSRVYFNSDSGSCGTDAEVMELSVPPFQ